jgi:photosystem II stability/assembly factor-like uncharacterized protein
MLGAVAALGGEDALLVCVGQSRALPSAVRVQAKYFYKTADGGRSWTRILTVPASLNGSALANGAVVGVVFRPDGRGWLWANAGGLYASDDGGRNWTATALVQELELEEPLSASFVGDGTGYALLELKPGAPYISLMETTDGGRTWKGVNGWAPRHG